MRAADEEEFRAFVVACLEPLRRMAFLLCRDWHTADDLVSITIGKLYRHWRRVSRAVNVDAYVRRVLTHAWLDERRRPWRREEPVLDLPDGADPGLAPPAGTGMAERMALLDLLAQLPDRRRAVVVLRFYCDLSVEDTSEILGISEGTVKSQAARGLETLRLLAKDASTSTARRQIRLVCLHNTCISGSTTSASAVATPWSTSSCCYSANVNGATRVRSLG